MRFKFHGVCAFLILLGFLATTIPVVLAQEDVEDLLPEGKPMLTAVEGDPADYLRIKLPPAWGWGELTERYEGILYGIPVKLIWKTVESDITGEAVALSALLTESSPEMSTLLGEWVRWDFQPLGWRVMRKDFLGDESWELQWFDFGVYSVLWRRGRIGAVVLGASRGTAYTFVELIDERMQPKVEWIIPIALAAGLVVPFGVLYRNRRRRGM